MSIKQPGARWYTVWTWALALILIASGSLVPSRASAAVAPGFPPSAVAAPTAPNTEESGPDAVEPEPLAGERVIGRTAFTRTEIAHLNVPATVRAEWTV